MVRCWFMDSSDEDQREPHMTNPPQFVDLEQLKVLTGVEYFHFPVQDLDTNESYATLKKSRGYNFEDTIEVSKDSLPNYEEKIKDFFKEHLHSDEEIRFIAAGSGYFDVRDKADRWIRVELIKDDLIILPAGIYHRFTLDSNNYIKARRLFCGEPVWTPINRPADEHPSRIKYCQALSA